MFIHLYTYLYVYTCNQYVILNLLTDSYKVIYFKYSIDQSQKLMELILAFWPSAGFDADRSVTWPQSNMPPLQIFTSEDLVAEGMSEWRTPFGKMLRKCWENVGNIMENDGKMIGKCENGGS